MKWYSVLSHEDLNDNLYKFYKVLDSVIETHVPLTTEFSSSYPKWYDLELKRAIQDKKRAHCQWKSSPSISNFIEFKRLRAQCLRLSRSKYKEYINSVVTGLRREFVLSGHLLRT